MSWHQGARAAVQETCRFLGWDYHRGAPMRPSSVPVPQGREVPEFDGRRFAVDDSIVTIYARETRAPKGGRVFLLSAFRPGDSLSVTHPFGSSGILSADLSRVAVQGFGPQLNAGWKFKGKGAPDSCEAAVEFRRGDARMNIELGRVPAAWEEKSGYTIAAESAGDRYLVTCRDTVPSATRPVARLIDLEDEGAAFFRHRAPQHPGRLASGAWHATRAFAEVARVEATAGEGEMVLATMKGIFNLLCHPAVRSATVVVLVFSATWYVSKRSA